MPKVYVYVKCPYCSAQYRGESDAQHAEGCPQPLEIRLMKLQWRQIINTCPLCSADVHVNNGDCFECLGCKTQWVAAWTQGTEAIRNATVWFNVHSESTLVTALAEKGEGKFSLRNSITDLSRQIMEAKTKFIAT